MGAASGTTTRKAPALESRSDHLDSIWPSTRRSHRLGTGEHLSEIILTDAIQAHPPDSMPGNLKFLGIVRGHRLQPIHRVSHSSRMGRTGC